MKANILGYGTVKVTDIKPPLRTKYRQHLQIDMGGATSTLWFCLPHGHKQWTKRVKAVHVNRKFDMNFGPLKSSYDTTAYCIELGSGQ